MGRLQQAVAQLTRYGGEPDRRVLELVEALTDVNDDIQNMRDMSSSIAKASKLLGDIAQRPEFAVAPVAVSVKGLEWEEAIHGGWCALGAAGLYHVHIGYRNETRFYFFTNPFDHEPNDFCSEKGAKAAAQFDYERRILAALSPTLAVPGDVVIVPRAPTQSMCNAAVDHTGAGSDMDWNGVSPQSLFRRAWFAMLAAAPPKPVADTGAVEAATELVDFAWSAVVTDCTESAEYLNELVEKLRAALAAASQRSAKP